MFWNEDKKIRVFIEGRNEINFNYHILLLCSSGRLQCQAGFNLRLSIFNFVCIMDTPKIKKCNQKRHITFR